MDDATSLIGQLQDALVARRAYGEPVQYDGGTILPVATVSGGGGGGAGPASGGDGGGFGVHVAPAGVFAVRNGKVSWHPAVKVNRIILGGQIVAIVALFTLRAILRERGRDVVSCSHRHRCG